jgi:hypothetical protein
VVSGVLIGGVVESLRGLNIVTSHVARLKKARQTRGYCVFNVSVVINPKRPLRMHLLGYLEFENKGLAVEMYVALRVSRPNSDTKGIEHKDEGNGRGLFIVQHRCRLHTCTAKIELGFDIQSRHVLERVR